MPGTPGPGRDVRAHSARLVLKVGPAKAAFSGKVTLTDLDAPSGGRIVGEGAGGVAGFAKAGAKVRLRKKNRPTSPSCTTRPTREISGELAQLGARLIDSTSRKLAADLFENLAAVVAPSS